MTEPVENEYETADDEQAAHSATFAMRAYEVIFRHFADVLDDDDDPWADKVSCVLAEAMTALEGLAWEEVRLRPGAPEAGRIWAAAFDAKHADEIAEVESWNLSETWDLGQKA
jgi:hypothetical protein